ncbi:MAG: flavodoxin [Gammaproteobacteria bacterium]|nr:MAG: flavodoxin [Gammaproteobacteria bacterium]
MSETIGLFYGSTTGMTEAVAKNIEEIAAARGITVDIHDTCYVDSPDEIFGYNSLILGTSTWYYGEHQGDWEDLLDKFPADVDLSHQTVALFGLGDQEGYAEYYLDAMGMIADEFERRGATIIGEWENDDSYHFEASKALRDDGDFFVGLALDEDCQEELTEERLATWLDEVLPILSAS